MLYSIIMLGLMISRVLTIFWILSMNFKHGTYTQYIKNHGKQKYFAVHTSF